MWNKIKRFDSSDTNVFKYVFTSDNAVAESVLYRYGSFEERTVICCSTMSGCPVGCTLGRIVGAALGKPVGCPDGSAVGCPDGLLLG